MQSRYDKIKNKFLKMRQIFEMDYKESMDMNYNNLKYITNYYKLKRIDLKPIKLYILEQFINEKAWKVRIDNRTKASALATSIRILEILNDNTNLNNNYDFYYVF